MLLKYNISNIKIQNEFSNIDILNWEINLKENDIYEVKVTTSKNHNLNVGDIIIITRDINGETNVLSEELRVEEQYFTKNTFSFIYPLYKNIEINNINNGNNLGFVRFENKFFLQLNEDDLFKLNRGYYNYISNELEYIEDVINCIYINGFYFKYNFKHYYKWDETNDKYILLDNEPDGIENIEIVEILPTTKLDDNEYLLIIKKIGKSDSFKIIDDRFIKDSVKLDGVKLYKNNSYINIKTPISSDNRNELNNEIISYSYFNEKKNELITDIDDYEKRCFTPYVKKGGKIEPIDKIVFNLFLRDRSGSDNWTSNDIMGWNQYKLEEVGNNLTFVNNLKTEGDLLTYLNFTDDDIYYRKEKVKRTFLRLSFYSNNTPLNNMLLFYSTIFLDSADLYNKYITCVNSNVEKPIVSNQNSNLTLSFSVSDRYNKNKSSEGFYLYLFPDNIDNIKERTIYMKAEFNHAGNGKTIPLIYPCKNNKILKFGDSGFPTSFINGENSDLNEYYKQSYIPLTIKYDSNLEEYIYYFNLANNKDNGLVFNLYEPKINSHDYN